MVIHEGAEKVLALADYLLLGPAGQSRSLHIGFGSRAVYLRPILEDKQ